MQEGHGGQGGAPRGRTTAILGQLPSQKGGQKECTKYISLYIRLREFRESQNRLHLPLGCRLVWWWLAQLPAGVAGGVGGVLLVPATEKLAKRLLPNGFAGDEASGNEVDEA